MWLKIICNQQDQLSWKLNQFHSAGELGRNQSMDTISPSFDVDSDKGTLLQARA